MATPPGINPKIFEIFMRRTLMTLVDRAGGQVTVFPEDLDEKGFHLIFKTHDNPPRIVWTIMSDERVKELAKDGLSAY